MFSCACARQCCPAVHGSWNYVNEQTIAVSIVSHIPGDRSSATCRLFSGAAMAWHSHPEIGVKNSYTRSPLAPFLKSAKLCVRLMGLWRACGRTHDGLSVLACDCQAALLLALASCPSPKATGNEIWKAILRLIYCCSVFVKSREPCMMCACVHLPLHCLRFICSFCALADAAPALPCSSSFWPVPIQPIEEAHATA